MAPNEKNTFLDLQKLKFKKLNVPWKLTRISILLPLLKVKLGKISEFVFDKLIEYLFRLSEVGSKGNTLCVNCQNNTKGEQCHQCMEGRNIFLQINFN